MSIVIMISHDCGNIREMERNKISYDIIPNFIAYTVIKFCQRLILDVTLIRKLYTHTDPRGQTHVENVHLSVVKVASSCGRFFHITPSSL